MLLITHDLGIVAGFAQDVLVMYAGAPVEYGGTTCSATRAPYTQALMAAVPRLTDERGGAASIPGSLPRADAIPPGCRFEARCRIGRGRERCRTDRPAFDLRDRGGASPATSEEARATAGGSHREGARCAAPRGAAPFVIVDLAKSYRTRGSSAP